MIHSGMSHSKETRVCRFNREKNKVGRPRLHWTLETYTQVWAKTLGKHGSYCKGDRDMEDEILHNVRNRNF